MRYEKSETIVRIALDMQGSALGLSLEDIMRNYAVKRRTAERLRDTVLRLFPVEEANPGEIPKRWRLPGSLVNGLVNFTADELADLATAVLLLRRNNMSVQADSAERVISKIRALLKRPAIARIDSDLEPLTEALGIAMRPGPKLEINDQNLQNLKTLREAIITKRKVVLENYIYRGSGKSGDQTVHPYGFIYGTRHHLVAWSENEQAEDFRSFVLFNIGNVRLLEETYPPKDDFSLQAYAGSSFGVYQQTPFNVVWRFSPKAAADARQFLFHPTQVLEDQPDGSLKVSFRAGGALEMCWHLFTWGGEVEILAPRKLRDEFRELCVKASRTAKAVKTIAGRRARPSRVISAKAKRGKSKS